MIANDEKRILRRLEHPSLGLGLGEGLSGGLTPFDPSILFANGEQGFWYDPTDVSTLFSDAAGQNLASADTSVGRLLDKSGRGNHMVQSSLAKQPIRRVVNGTSLLESVAGPTRMDTLGTVDFSGTDKITIFAALEKSSEGAPRGVVEILDVGVTNGTFLVMAPGILNNSYGFYVRGSATDGYLATGYAAPNRSIISCVLDIGGSGLINEVRPRINGSIPSVMSPQGSDAGSGNFSNLGASIFARPSAESQSFLGYLYGLAAVGRACTAIEIGAMERWLGLKSGIAY